MQFYLISPCHDQKYVINDVLCPAFHFKKYVLCYSMRCIYSQSCITYILKIDMLSTTPYTSLNVSLHNIFFGQLQDACNIVVKNTTKWTSYSLEFSTIGFMIAKILFLLTHEFIPSNFWPPKLHYEEPLHEMRPHMIISGKIYLSMTWFLRSQIILHFQDKWLGEASKEANKKNIDRVSLLSWSSIINYYNLWGAQGMFKCCLLHRVLAVVPQVLYILYWLRHRPKFMSGLMKIQKFS